MSSIYVAVPSISDTEFTKTLSRCLEYSSGLHEINIGAVGIYYDNEIKESDSFILFCKKNGINYKVLDRKNNLGVGIARKKAFSMYDGEDYILQVDAHSIFMKNWDQYLIDQFKYLKKHTGQEKVLFTAYPPEYKYFDETTTRPLFGWHKYFISEFSQNSMIEKTNHGRSCQSCLEWEPLPLWVEKDIDGIDENFIQNIKMSCAFIFSDKKFAKDYLKLIPYDFAFFEEELIMSIEALNLGWKFYAIKEGIPVAHLYIEHVNEYGGERSGLEESDLLKLNIKNNYLKYCFDEKNIEKIKNFEKYANVNIINTALSSVKNE